MDDPTQPAHPASEPAPVHKRRVRYRGTHPRKFTEKYKELNPQKYPDTVAKVVASGKTPAGMHRPIMVDEIVRVLDLRPGQTVVDCTLGYGGHAAELLKRIRPGGKLIALDADPIEIVRTEERLRAAGWTPGELIIRHKNFAALQNVLTELGVPLADAILADLGVSSMQLDDPARGFSYKSAGPLDLRLNPNKGISAANWLAGASRDKLLNALRENSDEPYADLISDAILTHQSDIKETQQLAEIVRNALLSLPRGLREREGDAPVRRTFQALRIVVNDEFGVLENLLRILPQCLAPNGRTAILTFHSGEDRRVKRSFQDGKRLGLYSAIADEPIRPGAEELRANPRSSSAKLRWAVRSQPL